MRRHPNPARTTKKRVITNKVIVVHKNTTDDSKGWQLKICKKKTKHVQKYTEGERNACSLGGKRWVASESTKENHSTPSQWSGNSQQLANADMQQGYETTDKPMIVRIHPIILHKIVKSQQNQTHPFQYPMASSFQTIFQLSSKDLMKVTHEVEP